MSVVYESGCVDCGFPCIRAACRYYEEVHYYCDMCSREITDESDVYESCGSHYCPECARTLDDFADEFEDEEDEEEEDEEAS